MEVGTVETEPLLALVSGLGSSVGLWRLLPTMQHLPTQHPATATPLLQPYPPLGTGVIPTSNITHMCPIAQLHGGRYSSKVQTPTESDEERDREDLEGGGDRHIGFSAQSAAFPPRTQQSPTVAYGYE
jgi:hypothetical protein